MGENAFPARVGEEDSLLFITINHKLKMTNMKGWLQTPRLPIGEEVAEAHRHATWLKLFYDYTAK